MTQHAKSLAARVKSDPALLSRALGDPGSRAKLPDKYLSHYQLAQRHKNQFQRDIGNLNTPLSGPSLINAAQQIATSDYAPLLQGIGQQEQVVNKSAGLQSGWAKRYYGDLNSLLGNIGTNQGTANTTAVQDAVTRGAAAQGAISGADQAARDRLTQDASVRGADVQGSAVADLAARTAAQQQNATGDATRAQTSAQQFGDAQAAFLRGLQGATAQQGGEYQGAITGAQNQALASLGQQRRELAGKQAGTFTDALLKLRGNEQQNAITAAGLGIKQDSAAAAADASAGSGGQKYGYTPSEWLALPASTRTAIVTAANKKTPKAPTGYGPKAPGMNKYGYTYDEWTGLSAADQAKARAGKGRKGGSGTGKDTGATNVQVGAAQTAAETAIADAKKAGIPLDAAHRSQLAHYLLSAQPESAATVTQKTKDGSVSRKVIQRPATDKHDPLFTSVALDVLVDGHVSRYNAGRLHARGLTVEDLGYPSYTDSQKRSGKAKLSPSERAPGGT